MKQVITTEEKPIKLWLDDIEDGAGRVLSRTKAKKTLDLATEQKKLDDLGVIHSIRSEGQLDEAAGAYKDIHTVMENQSDLVDILVELKPLAVIKG